MCRSITAILLLLVAFAFGAAAAPQATPAGYAAAQSKHYTIAHLDNSQWAEKTAATLESVREEFREKFASAGFALVEENPKYIWICFNSREAFDAYGRTADRLDVTWLNEYYSTRTNMVAVIRSGKPAETIPRVQTVAVTQLLPLEPEADVQNDIQRIRHEAAHQLAFNCGLQTRGIIYPIWVAEGIATFFESPCNNAVRSTRLGDILAYGELTPLPQLLVRCNLPATQIAIGDTYAESWGFFTFLFERYPEKLSSYMAKIGKNTTAARSDASIKSEFESVFGKISTLEKEWKDYALLLASR